MTKFKVPAIIGAIVLLIGVALFQIVPALADAPGPLDHVVLAPTSVTLAPGATQQFTAQGVDAANTPITGLTYFWMISAGGTIDTTGLFTAGTTAGTYTNTVQSVVVQGSTTRVANATVVVNPQTVGALHHVTVTPASAVIVAGGTQQFAAQAYDSNNVAITGLTYTWATVAGGGTVSTAGLFTAGATAGSFANTVQASTTQGATTVIGNATVTVTAVAGPLHHVTVSPAAASVPVGATQQFTAQGYDSANIAITGLSYTWVITAGGGTVNTTGLFTAGATAGSFPNTILVSTVQGATTVTGNASVTVTPAVTTPTTTPTTINAKLDVNKLISMFAGYFRATGFENFLGGQWQVKNGTAIDTVKLIPGIAQAVSATSITLLQNGQTVPATFAIPAGTNILPQKTTLAINDKVIVVTVNDQVKLISKINPATQPPGQAKKDDGKNDKKAYINGWMHGFKTGWNKACGK